MAYANRADRDAIEAEAPWDERDVSRTIWQELNRTTDAFPDRPAMTFQLFSDPKAKAETLTWRALRDQVAQLANMLRSLGVGRDGVVAMVLPNCTEAVVTYLAGMVAGRVNPINPLLEAEQMGAILRGTDARVLVTLRAFPQTDVAQKTAEAVRQAPNVEHVIEVDLHRYLTGLKKLVVPLLRPKVKAAHKAKIHAYGDAVSGRNTSLDFDDASEDRVVTHFHTGGTTGMPKVAQHLASGIIYNGWLGKRLLFTEEDNIICPLPMFHVFAAVVIVGAALSSGAHVVFPTPQGYRGEGVFDNFWKLCERHKITFMIAVPTAMSALMQRKVDADISSLKLAFSGSSPLPVELYRRFQDAAGVTICEGYGLTEATCLVSCNPVEGEKKIGSVGLTFPHTHVRILRHTQNGSEDCDIDEIGEICVDSPGVYHGATYTEAEKNNALFADDKFLRTGDLGRVDVDGYLWITGRAKDLIIRGGHNIDPADIEQALAGHDAVAMAGAIGQPDAHAGELPCAYVELVSGADISPDDLLEWIRPRIQERAAMPKYIEILDELPKTAVGKVFKPDLRKRAITRVLNETLREHGLAAEITAVRETKSRGLVAFVKRTGDVDDAAVRKALGDFAQPWSWDEENAEAA